MTPLITGIYSKFVAAPANSLYTALSGRLYHAQAPQGATFPYGVVFTVSHEHDWTFTHTFEDVTVQFSLFTNESSASNIGTLWTYLTALYDDASITITGYSHLYMIRSSSRLIREPDKNIWHYSIDYDCLEQKS